MYVLICYDISSPSRLRRVARVLEKHAVRCQKSVFLFHGSSTKLRRLLQILKTEICEADDIVQAWTLSRDETPTGTALGNAACIEPGALILGQDQTHLVRHRHIAKESRDE